ncbi:hypothetical protein LJC48_06770, partial [Desulfovibrio sp. OttesenSCG-928-C06]|nr:hypothetical protein [Desulfovibrio sp. OttesenSCG-928-C06]
MKYFEFPHEKVEGIRRVCFYGDTNIDMDKVSELYNSISVEYFENKGERIKEFFNMPYPFILTREDNKCYAAIEFSKQALSDCDSVPFWRVFRYVYVPELITYMCSAYKHCHRYG